MSTLREIIEKIEVAKTEAEFMPTGFYDLDQFLDGGFLRKELVVLGGSTGIGKSYVAGQMFFNIAQKGFKCAYFSLEISNEMVVSRMVGSIANIKPTRVNIGWLNPEEIENKNKAVARLLTFEDYLIFHDDIYSFDKLQQAIKDGGYDMVVVDFIQNIEVLGMNDEYSRLTYVARQLQNLAKETNSCIMALSQLSNSVASQAADKGTIEYRGSGAIAHACDLGFFIERGDGQNPNLVRLFLKKNRRGISGKLFELIFHNPGGRIEQREDIYDFRGT